LSAIDQDETLPNVEKEARVQKKQNSKYGILPSNSRIKKEFSEILSKIGQNSSLCKASPIIQKKLSGNRHEEEEKKSGGAHPF